MVKFFTPTFSASNTDTIKFEATGDNHNSTTIVTAKTKKRRNKKKLKPVEKKSSTSASASGAGALTPKAEKVKRGRIKKRENVKGSKKLRKSFTNMQEAGVNMLSSLCEDTIVDSEPSTSEFAKKLKTHLMGGRFRLINEQLYTMDSCGAEDLFRNDEEAFDDYHCGYQQQVAKWPLNPLDRIIKMVLRLPKSLEIADFGCGEGKLSKAVPHKVYSIDLVSRREDIIVCDMANTPLTAESLDVAIYCLSLMGTNLKEYFLEANRVLKINGLVYIAEIKSRFEDVKSFIRGVSACGFELVKQDLRAELFYFFQFKKVRNVGRVTMVAPFSLKPCLYRKR